LTGAFPDLRVSNSLCVRGVPGGRADLSFAAHELESYFIQVHTKARVSYLALLIGCLSGDMCTKPPMYGVKHRWIHAQSVGPIAISPWPDECVFLAFSAMSSALLGAGWRSWAHP
jgi:hypothetical protein